MHDTLTHTRKDHKGGHTALEDANLQRVEVLAEELKQLLERNNSAFDDETIRRQIDHLEHWMTCYRRDLVTTDTFSQASASLLEDLRSRLKLAAEELQRLEGEGGNPATKEQTKKTEELLSAIRRSERLLTNIEELFPVGKH